MGVTLARGGSKAVPRKNIRLVGGLPLIAHTILEAKKSKYLSEYIVSTDDLEISEISLQYGAKVPFIRPKKLAQDKSTSVEALIHAVRFMENLNKMKFEFIVEIMATNPLKKVEDIDGCIELLLNTSCNSVVAVNRIIDSHPARAKKIENGRLVNFCVDEIPESRRQDLLPHAYVRSGSIYAFKRDLIINEHRRYDNVDTRPYILPANRVINIDEETDLHFVNFLMSKGISESS